MLPELVIVPPELVMLPPELTVMVPELVMVPPERLSMSQEIMMVPELSMVPPKELMMVPWSALMVPELPMVPELLMAPPEERVTVSTDGIVTVIPLGIVISSDERGTAPPQVAGLSQSPLVTAVKEAAYASGIIFFEKGNTGLTDPASKITANTRDNTLSVDSVLVSTTRKFNSGKLY